MPVRFIGQPPISDAIYELESLRYHRRDRYFTAQAPAEVGPEKYDAKAPTLSELLKYGSTPPFNRLQLLKDNMRIPLPASTQWEIVQVAAGKLRPVWDEFRR